MSEWSAPIEKVGRKALDQMVKDSCRRSRVFIYGKDTKPLGVVTLELKTFDPKTGE